MNAKRWRLPARLPLLPLILLVGVACGKGAASGLAPRITPLNAPNAKNANGRPIDLQGSVIDASTGEPIPFAHVSYNKQVVKADANGGFAMQSQPANQTLYVVAAGYRRFTGTWNSAQSQIKLTPFHARAIYMPYAGLTEPTIMATIDKDTNNTEINALVLEVKTDDGQVPAEMSTPATEETHAVAQGADLKSFVAKMHERNIYLIGRFVVFRDPALAATHPDWSLRFASTGKTYEDEQGQKWMDAFRQENWQYNIDIAEKAAQLGFDEIQFDYIRFPGAISPLLYGEPMTQENRVAAIGGFLKRAEDRLRPYGVALAVDTFGLTTIALDDTGIGQDLTVLGKYLDYYCPMVYPSTWANGSFGIAYPPADPYTIVHDSVESATRRLSDIPTVKVRPWLQSFDDYKSQRLDYTPERVNIQKTAADKAGASGWMLWHPLSHYDAATIGPKSPASATTAGR